MKDEEVRSPLTVSDLERAAWLCLMAAAETDTDQLFGDPRRSMHHERKKRFEQARRLVEGGVTFLSELGLSHIDCAWAAGKVDYVKDKEDWSLHFQVAECELKKVLQQQVDEIINGPQPA